ncbi:MAG TPA: hypothetical protein ENK57_15270 [Polyangiaceae bacterium]|nr:hypothetical protein [Polyangiaceae bacterium]
MMKRLRRRTALFAVLASLALPHAPARADEGAAAQILWEQGRDAAREGDFEAACPKFAESQRLDPQLGTLMNLADCYSRIGKVASAWAKFVEAAEMAKSRQDPREAEARRRAEELEPKLIRFELSVAEPVAGMKVYRGDEDVAEAMWGTPVPVDPGTFTVIAEAEGYLPYEEEVDLTEEGATVRLEIPPLEPAPEDATSSGSTTSGGDDGMSTGLLVSGVVAASLGAIGIGLGTAFLVIAKGKDDDSLTFCEPDDPTLCSQQGVDLRDEARSAQTIGIAGLVTGGVLGVTGAALIVSAYLTGDDGDEVAVVPWASPAGAGIVTTVRF